MANSNITYSNKTRRNINHYSYKNDLIIFNFFEYLESLFPKIFPKDKIRKIFSKKYLFIVSESRLPTILPLENCIANIVRSSKNLIADGGYNYKHKEKIVADFKMQSPFSYEFFSRIRTKKDTDDIFGAFDDTSRKVASNGGYLEAIDMLELTKLIYKMILMYEQNMPKLEQILKAAENIGFKYLNKDDRYQVSKDIDAFRDGFKGLCLTYKRELYVLILKYVDFCIENESDKELINYRNATIRAFLEIKNEDIFNYDVFVAEQEKLRAIRESLNKAKIQEQDVLTQRLMEGINFIDMLYPNSSFKNILNYEYVLPYFLNSLIKKEQINIDIQELEIMSREDPIQIILVIFSVIWYKFLLIFDIEDLQDNAITINEIGTIKTRWEKFFGIFKAYFEALLSYNREFNGQRKEISERIFYEMRFKIIFRKKPNNSETLVDIVNDLLEFLYKIENNKIAFFIRSEKNNSKIAKDDSINVFSNYKRLIEIFRYLLTDKSSFLLPNIEKAKFAGIEEKEVLKKYNFI